MLLLLSVALGGVVATRRDAVDVRVLGVVLAVGQLLGHALLGAGGHTHQPSVGAPPWVMVAAHLVAIVIGAALIAVGGRLGAAMSRALVAAARLVQPPVAAVPPIAIRSVDHPLQSVRLLSASLSHRGPPLGLAL